MNKQTKNAREIKTIVLTLGFWMHYDHTDKTSPSFDLAPDGHRKQGARFCTCQNARIPSTLSHSYIYMLWTLMQLEQTCIPLPTNSKASCLAHGSLSFAFPAYYPISGPQGSAVKVLLPLLALDSAIPEQTQSATIQSHFLSGGKVSETLLPI